MTDSNDCWERRELRIRFLGCRNFPTRQKRAGFRECVEAVPRQAADADMNPIAYLTIDDCSKLLQSVAIVVGGVAAYFKWFRGRVYRPRLETTAGGSLKTNGGQYLHVTVRTKNVGLSEVRIEEKGSGVRILSGQPASGLTIVKNVVWKHCASFPIYEEHGWIESNETIEHQRLVQLPQQEYLAFRIEVSIASKGIVWKTDSIVLCSVD